MLQQPDAMSEDARLLQDVESIVAHAHNLPSMQQQLWSLHASVLTWAASESSQYAQHTLLRLVSLADSFDHSTFQEASQALSRLQILIEDLQTGVLSADSGYRGTLPHKCVQALRTFYNQHLHPHVLRSAMVALHSSAHHIDPLRADHGAQLVNRFVTLAAQVATGAFTISPGAIDAVCSSCHGVLACEITRHSGPSSFQACHAWYAAPLAAAHMQNVCHLCYCCGDGIQRCAACRIRCIPLLMRACVCCTHSPSQARNLTSTPTMAATRLLPSCKRCWLRARRRNCQHSAQCFKTNC
jgi:hypothetical protein